MKRSPFFYVGDKYKLSSQLAKYFPKKINTLIEPFVGGGSVFLNIDAKSYIANDINPYVIKLHKFLKLNSSKKQFFDQLHNLIRKYGLSASFLNINVPNALKKAYPKTYYAHYNKEAYSRLKSDFNKDKNNMFLLYLLLIYGFNHMIRFNSKGDFNLPVGNVDYNKNVVNALKGYFDFCKNNKISFYNLDFEKFIFNKIKIKKDDVIYFDPPYLITSSEYNKLWSEKNERRLLYLLDWLNSKGYKFALSNVVSYKNKQNNILIKWAQKYNVIKITSNYINFNDNTNKKGIKEVLITNYAAKKSI